MTKLVGCAMVLVLAGVARADEPDDLVPPAPDHARTDQIVLPAVPAFTLPHRSDGSPTVRELYVHGTKLLDTTVTVHGVITWVYDCATAIRRAGESDRTVKKRIDEDPTQCERPKFYLGDEATTSPDKSLWIVDVPRPYNKLELERITPAERTMPDRCEPGAKDSICPPYKVGDRVSITGKFTTSSPHSERNSDGLVVFSAMKNITRQWQTPGTTWSDAAARLIPADASTPLPTIQPEPPAAPPLRKVIDKAKQDESVALARAGRRASAQKQFADAASKFQQAIDAWPGNHVAWFGLGATFAAQGRWAEAADGFAHTVELRPDVATYQLWEGIALYERTSAAARADQARKANVRPEDVMLDQTLVNLELPRQHLLAAVQRDPALWRAHYYLGKIERAASRSREAAAAFTRALQSASHETAPYVALAALYRKWDYTDEAIAVAMTGTQQVVATAEATDVWYELGMGYDDKRQNAQAIAAFTKALELAPDSARALFQRGQVYFRSGARAKAKQDLDAVVASTRPGLGFAKQQAHAMLRDLATRR